MPAKNKADTSMIRTRLFITADTPRASVPVISQGEETLFAVFSYYPALNIPGPCRNDDDLGYGIDQETADLPRRTA